MDLSHRLELSYYKTIATINEEHHIYLVQHQSTNKIFIKKILDVYNLTVYENLYKHPIPGTPRIIDFCEEGHQLILIEEYISGTSLYDKILQGDLNDHRILNYSIELCHILEKLHTLNPPVIHRDIKPSNIIITNYDHAVLLDFNAAKQFDSTEHEDTVLLGTQGYAAPEQYGFGSSSPQTDIYSLGIVIKEMMTACNSSSKELLQIVEACTQLDPRERYASISDLRYEIEELTAPTPQHKHKKSKAHQNFLPPGYRTHTPWKMLVASISYLCIFLLCVSLEVKNVSVPDLWLNRFFAFIILLSIVFGCFNYLNIQQLVPLCKNKNTAVRYLGIAVLDIAVSFFLFLLLFVIEALFFK